MSQALVCSANGEYRTSCSSLCDACLYMIRDRRRQLAEKVSWTPRERRVVTNLVHGRYRIAGAEALALDGEGNAAAGPWYLLAALVIFNLLDCVFTARAMSLGYAEANPLMDALFRYSIPIGMLGKSVFVGLGALVLYRYRHLGLAARGLAFLTVIYGLLVTYHTFFLLTA